MINIHQYKTPDEAAKQAAEVIQASITDQSIPCLFLTAGGSALGVLNYLDPLVWKNVTISVLDERYVADISGNNFLQLAETAFFKRAQEHHIAYIDTSIQNNESQEQLADRFDYTLKQWIANNPEGYIIAIIGIGDDGHISGMMPFLEDPKLFESLFVHTNRYVIAYDAQDKNAFPLRVTTTVPFLQKITKAVVYVVGEKKKKALQYIEDTDVLLYEAPAIVLQQLKDVSLFTDQSF